MEINQHGNVLKIENVNAMATKVTFAVKNQIKILSSIPVRIRCPLKNNSH